MEIKIICGQLEITPGRPDLNYEKIIAAMDEARARGADILLLPEMCLPGYLIGDLWEQQSFLDDCNYYAQAIIAASRGLCVMFGSVATEAGRLNEDGRVRKYNAAFACCDGKPLAGYLGRSCVIKSTLPNYREFDDARHFYSLPKLCAAENACVKDALQPLEVTIRGARLRIGLMLCEDGWTENYQLNVPQTLADNGAQILCNLSCSPYTLGKNRKRNRLFSAQAQKAGIPLIYCNNVGVQNNGKNIFTYDGCTSAYNGDGKLTAAAAMYDETLLELIWDTESARKFSSATPGSGFRTSRSRSTLSTFTCS